MSDVVGGFGDSVPLSVRFERYLFYPMTLRVTRDFRCCAFCDVSFLTFLVLEDDV